MYKIYKLLFWLCYNTIEIIITIHCNERLPHWCFKMLGNICDKIAQLRDWSLTKASQYVIR